MQTAIVTPTFANVGLTIANVGLTIENVSLTIGKSSQTFADVGLLFAIVLQLLANYSLLSSSVSAALAFRSGRRCGNRITSRIECLLVSSITRRSIPIPIPAAGGIP